MTVVALILVGIAAGVIGSSLGIGGGVIFVPALVLLLGFDQHLAEGTSLAVILPTAAVGAWSHHRQGRVVWRTALGVGAAGIVGAIVGSRVAFSLDAVVLRRLYAALIAVITIEMIIRSFRLGAGPQEQDPSPEDAVST
ncbi:hypothetical protein BH24ACT7_BH24ACT7_18350 [soil metagenome]